MNKSYRLKLFIMMALEFFILGAWLPLIYAYLPGLGFTPLQQSLVLNAFPLATIVGMFFSNQFADRNFAAEKFLAFSQFVGGLAMLGCGFTRAFWPFFLLMLVHCLLYVPTMSITNSIAFANMKDPQKEFGAVRMGGSIGWVLAAWPFTFIFVDWAKVHATTTNGFVEWMGTVLKSGLSGQAFLDMTRWTFIVAALASFALALFSLTLPHTPPKKAGEGAAGSLAWLEAMKELKKPYAGVLWIITLVASFLLYCHFNWTGAFLGVPSEGGGPGIGGNWIMPVMSIGQVMEMLSMLVLGVVLKRLGWRMTMIVGILGHTARFAIYAFFPQNQFFMILIQVVHGICFAFFFGSVWIFVDTYFPKDTRSSAQGLFNMMIFGFGTMAANIACPWLKQSIFTQDGVTNYRSLFLVPMIVSIVAVVALALFFHPPKTATAEGDASKS